MNHIKFHFNLTTEETDIYCAVLILIMVYSDFFQIKRICEFLRMSSLQQGLKSSKNADFSNQIFFVKMS